MAAKKFLAFWKKKLLKKSDFRLVGPSILYEHRCPSTHLEPFFNGNKEGVATGFAINFLLFIHDDALSKRPDPVWADVQLFRMRQELPRIGIVHFHRG